jgi:coenzyme F420 hydrogenase subunit beta
MDYLGKYKTAVAARSKNAEVLKCSQDGGIVTSMFIYALEEGIIDGAIVAGPGEKPWQPKPIVATSAEEILSAQGTKYNISPNMSVLKDAVRKYGLDKVGIVGTPCQIQALRKAQLYPIGLRDVGDKIALALGIFCMENFPYQGMKQIVEDHCNVNINSLKKMDIGKGKFWAYTNRGAVTQIGLKATHKYEQPGCHVCLDYVSNLADISTGSVGSPDGWSTVFIRNTNGENIWNKAVAAGVFETKAIESVKPGLELVTKLATEKITKNQKELEHRVQFGVGKGLRNPYI